MEKLFYNPVRVSLKLEILVLIVPRSQLRSLVLYKLITAEATHTIVLRNLL